jgi:acetate kinase
VRNVLVINCGSSSLKYQLLDMDEERLLAKGLVERIGLAVGKHVYQRPGRDDVVEESPVPDHERAMQLVLAALTAPVAACCGA